MFAMRGPVVVDRSAADVVMRLAAGFHLAAPRAT
jgi:hypothetical protein